MMIFNDFGLNTSTNPFHMLFSSYFCIENKGTKILTNMKENNNISRETWRTIIQAAIAILTVISGMFFESCTSAMSHLLAIF